MQLLLFIVLFTRQPLDSCSRRLCILFGYYSHRHCLLAPLFKSLWKRSYIDTLKRNLFWCCLPVKMSPDTTAKMLGHKKNNQTLICIVGLLPFLHPDNLPPSNLLVQMSLPLISGHTIPINNISKLVGLIILANLCSYGIYFGKFWGNRHIFSKKLRS